MTYSATVLGTAGLVAYWRLGEPSGTVAADSFGSNTGTYVGSPTLGLPGLLFGGTDTAVGFVAASGQRVLFTPLNIAGAFTHIVWGSAASYAAQSGSAFTQGIGTQKWGTDIGTMFVRVTDGGSFDKTVAAPSVDTPHMFALIRDSSNVVTMSIDAAAATTLFGGAAQVTNWQPTSISHNNAFGVTGTLDEVSIYSVALTPAQISAQYSDGTGHGSIAPSGSAYSGAPSAGAFSGTPSGTSPLMVPRV